MHICHKSGTNLGPFPALRVYAYIIHANTLTMHSLNFSADLFSFILYSDRSFATAIYSYLRIRTFSSTSNK